MKLSFSQAVLQNIAPIVSISEVRYHGQIGGKSRMKAMKK